MELPELLNLLAPKPGTTAFPVIAPSKAIYYPPSKLPEFVAPSLRLKEGTAVGSKVVIISAAGAVGKTTLAREIAFDSGAPYCDLSEQGPVGQHSLVGALTVTFGAGALSTLTQRLQSGDLCIAIDALDEARVKVTESAFDAFISDIASLAASASAPAFILFGRTQIAELVWLLLDEASVQTCLLEIEHFDRPRAIEYIDKRIQQRDHEKWNRVEQHREPFVAARDVIFDCLDKAITGIAENDATKVMVSTFLGYAPVLDAISVLLQDTTNFLELRSEIASDVGTGKFDQPVKLLRKIVENILDREWQNKLVKNIRPALESTAGKIGWSNWNSLYTSSEQVARLMGRLTGQDGNLWGHKLPTALQSTYEDQLKQWLPEHPFLRDGNRPANVVFESYLCARAMVTEAQAVALAAETYVNSTNYKATRLFADFYVLLLQEIEGDLIRPQHIGIVYEAALAGETEDVKVRFTLESSYSMGDPASEIETLGELEFVYCPTDGVAQTQETLVFKTSLTAGSTIRFRHHIRDASVVVPCEVCLGANADDFLIGPNVAIECRYLRIASRHLSVDTLLRRSSSTDNAAVLECDQFSGSSLDRPTVRGQLRVAWPGADGYPWHEFKIDQPAPGSADTVVSEMYRRFRRIVMTLRSHSKGSLARYRDKIEHQRVLKGQIGKLLLEKLVEDNVLIRDEKFYYWNSAVADKIVGVSWGDLRIGVCPPPLTAYLEKFISDSDVKFDAVQS